MTNSNIEIPHQDSDMRMNSSLPETPISSRLQNKLNRQNSNSPNAVSWEKFRDKNPEFKRYQRAASLYGECWFFFFFKFIQMNIIDQYLQYLYLKGIEFDCMEWIVVIYCNLL